MWARTRGYFSFHMHQRGAAEVVAADEFSWTWPGSSTKPHFEGVRSILGQNVKDVTTSVENLSLNIKKKFDVVLFLGVLYHAPNMIQYLSQVAAVTKRVCVLETYLDLLDHPTPAAEFYPPNPLKPRFVELVVGPKSGAVVNMCLRAGFSNRGTHQFLGDQRSRHIYNNIGKFGAVKSARAVFYAYV